MCDVVTYVPKKDSELDLTKNIIHQQVEGGCKIARNFVKILVEWY
jgi:hypothetical protein